MFQRFGVLMCGVLCLFTCSESTRANQKPTAPKEKVTKDQLVKLGEMTGTISWVDLELRAILFDYAVQIPPNGDEKHILVHLDAAEGLIVRLPEPPGKFDKRGKPLVYTAKELKELRGPDPKQPGFTGDFSNLKNGQKVLVTLAQKKEVLAAQKEALTAKKPVPKKPVAKKPTPTKTKTKKDDEPEPPAGPMYEKAFMTRVVVLAHPPPE